MNAKMWNRPGKDIAVAILFLGMCVMLVCAALWAYRAFISTPPYVDPEKYPVRGIDVSAHNGTIDMQAVRHAGYEFVFIKATEGKTFTDRNFRTNYNKALQAGLKIGVYHFFRFDRDGVEQAINLLKTVGSRQPQLGLAIDVEKAGNPDTIPEAKVIERLTNMVDYLNLLGHRVMFYTNTDGYYTYLAENFPGCTLWICGFHENPIQTEWTFWQYNHRGRIPGVKGDVDLDAFCGTRSEWNNYLRGNLWPYSTRPGQ